MKEPMLLRRVAVYYGSPSGLSSLSEDQIAERGTRMARRDDRGYREYLREEQRRQARGPQRGSRVGVEEGCPARELCCEPRGQDNTRRSGDSWI